MKVCVIGTRGFPNVQGGIETHCEELYPRIADKYDCEIVVFRRTPYIKNKQSNFKNVRFVDIWVPKNKYLETFLHSFLSTLYSIFLRPDIVHYHNSGPAVFSPLIKLFRGKVVFTYHNISYTQKKWNQASKLFLSITEKITFKFTDSFIFISNTIKSIMEERYNFTRSTIIRNGVKRIDRSSQTDYLESLGLTPFKYIIGVGRFLEEKGFDYLIDAFKLCATNDIKLVIVGDTDYPTSYSIKLKKKAAENNVILTGFIKDEKLRQIFSFARLYIMSSFEEGLPIALLEAMNYNLDVLASDIKPNLEVELDKNDYFPVGNTSVLAEKINEKIKNSTKRDFSLLINEKYNWDSIATSTYEFYNKTAKYD